MPVKKMLDLESLTPWDPKPSDSIPQDRGALEHVFIQMFSMIEKMEAMVLGAAPMGKDPHNDARQTILCFAKMLDQDESSKTHTRGIINLDDQTEGIVVDMVSYRGKKVWTLGGEDNEPIVFIRYAYHTADFEDESNNPVDTFAVVQAIGRSMPPRGATTVTCASKEEMIILKRFFEDNAAKISPSLRKVIEGDVDEKLMRIPLSFTSYLCPLAKPEADKEVKYCKVCGSVAKKVCTKCKVARYCSKECQVQDWKSGHKRACKAPELVALEEATISGTPDVVKKTETPWVDFDPKKTPPEANYFSTISNHSSVSSIQKNLKSKLKRSQDMFEGIKTDKMLIVKVQIPTGSQADDFSPMVIYPQGKKFEIYGVPQNIVKGCDDYRRIHNLVKSRGFDGGLGMGGCKIYLDAYITSEGLLRVMLNDIKPMQKW